VLLNPATLRDTMCLLFVRPIFSFIIIRDDLVVLQQLGLALLVVFLVIPLRNGGAALSDISIESVATLKFIYNLSH
jgi:hypothetical protein